MICGVGIKTDSPVEQNGKPRANPGTSSICSLTKVLAAELGKGRRIPTCRRRKLDHYLSSPTQLAQLGFKIRNFEVTRRKYRGQFYFLKLQWVRILGAQIPKAQKRKANVNSWDFNKGSNQQSEETTYRWKNVFSSYISDEGLITRIQKELK